MCCPIHARAAKSTHVLPNPPTDACAPSRARARACLEREERGAICGDDVDVEGREDAESKVVIELLQRLCGRVEAVKRERDGARDGEVGRRLQKRQREEHDRQRDQDVDRPARHQPSK
eukprot:3988360-Pleurochrysis_carterae.AAC.1